MFIGVPKEIKVHEYRVGLTPDSAREFVTHGHKVIVETKAGAGIGCSDDDYRAIGAEIAATAGEVFQKAEMIVKVKEPQAPERKMLKEGQLLFTYLHLAPDPDQTRELVDSGAVCVAYETVTNAQGGLPCWRPCPRWRAGCRSRREPGRWRRRTAEKAFFWVACPAWLRPRWW